MFLYTKKRFSLSPEGIDAAAEMLMSELERLKISRKDALRLRLSVEEVLLKWLPGEGMADGFTIELTKRWKRIDITIRCAGQSIDPMASVDDENFGANQLGRSMLENLGLSPAWQYRNGVNIVTASQRLGKPVSQFVQVAIAAVAALILGKLAQFLPAGILEALQSDLMDPLFNTFLGLLSCIVGPMMFLSMVWGIFNIGDARQLGVIGKKLLLRFFAVCTLFGAVCMGVAVLFWQPEIGDSQGGQGIVRSVVEMVLGVVPDDIVSPFLDGNTLQILFMGVVVGVAMIFLRDRMQTLSQIVEQSNAVVQYILSAISAMVPGFIFLSVLQMVMQGTLAQSASGLLTVVLLSVALTFGELAAELMSLIRLGVRPLMAVKKLLPIFLIAVSTASSAATFPSMMECSEKRLGMADKMVNFALPFGNVIFKPNMVNMFVLLPLFAAQEYGVALSASSLILCLISAVILSVAAPPIPGGALTCYTLLFMQLGIPAEALTLAAAASVLLDFSSTAGDMCSLLINLTHSAKSLDMLDTDILRRG